MPGVRDVRDRLEKYGLKYPDAATMTARITAVKTLMDLRYEGASSPIVNVVDAVRSILEAEGVPAGMHGVYYAFAQMLQKALFSHSDATLGKVASGLKSYFVTAFGAEESIIDAILLAVLGTVPPY